MQAELDDLGIPDYQVPALYSKGDADTGDGVEYMTRKVVRSASMSLESEDAEDIIEVRGRPENDDWTSFRPITPPC